MLKAIEFFRGREDLMPEAFLEHWMTCHTDVVLGVEGLRRYVQNPVIGLAGVPPADCHGVVEVWFDNLAAMRAAAQSPYWQTVVADEKRFINRESRSLLLAEDADPPPIAPGPKVFVRVHKLAAWSVEDFQAQVSGWRHARTPAAGEVWCGCDFPIPSTYQGGYRYAADALISARFEAWHDAEQALAAGALAPAGEGVAGMSCVAAHERVIVQ